MGKFYFIGIVIFLAIAYLGIVLGVYIYLKQAKINGKPLIEQPVNQQERTDTLGPGEFLVYFSMIAIAAVFAMRAHSPTVSKLILLPPVMALFNARKRTGKALFALLASFTFVLFLMMADLIIGFPQKAPDLTISDTKIIMAETTFGDVVNQGFDIYIRQEGSPRADYKDFISSGTFKKYPANRSAFVEKGFRRDGFTVSYAPYLLVKEDVVIGGIDLYGDENKDIVLEDCKIIKFKLDVDCIAAIKAKELSCELSGFNLLQPLKQERVKETFGEKLWLTPINLKDISQLHYGISWTNNSHHIFWNEYYAYIDFDEKNNMISFELESVLPRE